MAAKKKSIVEYLETKGVENAHKTSLDSYSLCPAEAFLTYVCDAHDSVIHCTKKFTKKEDGEYNKDSLDSLRHISSAMFAAIMGHFETYQKTLFAGLIDRTTTMSGFDTAKFAKDFGGQGSTSLSIERLLAYRDARAPVGLVLADTLSGWHNPNTVCKHFGLVARDHALFSASEISELAVYWQLRHSIVHTGSWITTPDAQKIRPLVAFANKPIIFKATFANAVARRLHEIVKRTNNSLEKKLFAGPLKDAKQEVRDSMLAFLKVESPKKVWLK
jgi:hypothetical protein